ncbi:MAG: MBL fold metallo-hydrolase [Myxococcaceae bacterium]|nr:MBL fold metallo-hydrolase [Myxococcaceae bacterium]
MNTLLAVMLCAAPLKVTSLTASPQGFFVTSTLVTGEKEAVLIDNAFTLADAHRVVAAVLDSGKTLTTVYVTHGHPDHYFGLVALKEAFPNAKLVARPDVVAEISKTWKAKVDQWGPMYGANLTSAPVVPEALSGDVLTLEGEKLQITGTQQGDDSHNSFVWIPSAKAVVAGDVVYNNVHVWTAETKAKDRKAWLATLDKLEKLKPEVVVAGHKAPDAKDDVSAIAFTREYLKAFDAAVSSSKTAAEALEKVKAKYPNAALDIIAKLGTDAQYAK